MWWAIKAGVRAIKLEEELSTLQRVGTVHQDQVIILNEDGNYIEVDCSSVSESDEVF